MCQQDLRHSQKLMMMVCAAIDLWQISEVLNYSASRQGCSSTWLSRHETRETVPSNTFVGTPFAHPIPLNVEPQDGIETLAIDHFQYSFVLSCQAFDLKLDLR